MKDLTKINILLIENNDEIRKATSFFLSYIAKNLYAVKSVEAEDIALKNDIDLIMFNINDINIIESIERKKIITSIVRIESIEPDIVEIAKIQKLRWIIFNQTNQSEILEKIDIIMEEMEIEKKRIEDEKILNKYKLAIDNTMIVSKTDIKGNIIYVNEKFCEISGYKESELLNKNHNIVRHPDMPKELFKELWKKILNKEEWSGIIKNKKKDGTHYYVDSNVFPLLDLNGEIKEFISLRKDITDEMNQKLELGKDNKKLKEYDKKINEVFKILRFDRNMKLLFSNNNSKLNNSITEEIVKLKSEIIIQPELKEISIKALTNKYFDFTIKIIKDKNNEIEEYMFIGKDISELIKLHKEMEKTQKDVILTLGTIGEKRDHETGKHVKRVQQYSSLLASLYGLDEDTCELIKIASAMHDLGKVAIRDSILHKPDKLTTEEFDYMKNHAKFGYEMLKHSNLNLIKMSANIAHEHHEKWNGTGYPRGIKEENINIFARIVSVADVFDALSTERPYKKKWLIEDIVDFFKKEKGISFDPKLVDLLLENLEKFIFIKEKLKD